jgi:N-terminal domain of molybdenum-binding protein
MLQVHASVAFEGKHSIAGRDRIRLLEAVGREGSISGAARAVGLSYKAAWDAIDGLNALFGRLWSRRDRAGSAAVAHS